MEKTQGMYRFLDRFFIVFHTGLILFNLLGWVWKKTRLANLATLTATLLSWTVLGIWGGFGYCPLTDYHWQVRVRLGETDMPSSYIKFLVDTLTGLDVSARLVNLSAIILLALALAASATTNALSFVSRRHGLDS
jgi:hypothetical protein